VYTGSNGTFYQNGTGLAVPAHIGVRNAKDTRDMIHRARRERRRLQLVPLHGDRVLGDAGSTCRSARDRTARDRTARKTHAALMKERRPSFPALEASAAPASEPRQVFVLKNGRRIESGHEEIDTAVLTLSPALLQALRAIAPKKRRSAIPYVLVLALATVVASVAGLRTTRELISLACIGDVGAERESRRPRRPIVASRRRSKSRRPSLRLSRPRRQCRPRHRRLRRMGWTHHARRAGKRPGTPLTLRPPDRCPLQLRVNIFRGASHAASRLCSWRAVSLACTKSEDIHDTRRRAASRVSTATVLRSRRR